MLSRFLRAESNLLSLVRAHLVDEHLPATFLPLLPRHDVLVERLANLVDVVGVGGRLEHFDGRWKRVALLSGQRLLLTAKRSCVVSFTFKDVTCEVALT